MKKVRKLLAMTVIPLVLIAAAVHGQSPLDGFDPNANDQVLVVVVQPDGKVLIGGNFTTLSPNGGAPVTRNYIARLNPDGTLDTVFNPNANYTVYAIAVQADGKILVGGNFNGANSIGGQTRNYIARLDGTTGSADSFDPNANFWVYSITLQTDGKVLACGAFTSMGGQTRVGIARLDPTTGLVDSFNPNSSNGVLAIAVQADGKILAGGWFTSIGGQTRNHIARLDPATGLADSFDPNSNGDLYSIAVLAEGKILVGGWFTSIGGQTGSSIARLDATTGLADSFNPNGNGSVGSIAVQMDGKILAGGNFTSMGGQARNNIARLDAMTGLADSFDPNANDVVRSIAVQADGKILVGGYLTSIGGQTRNRIARLTTPTQTPTPAPSATPCTTTITFSNPATIYITDPGPTQPYPSSITVTGVPNPITKVTVTISLSIIYPTYVDMLLVGPGGRKFILVSDAGGDPSAMNGVTWILDDAAIGFVPYAGTPVSGTFKPTNYGGSSDFFYDPAPPPPYLSPGPDGTDTLAIFAGVDPNVTWGLYVVRCPGCWGFGSVPNGWSINITTESGSCPSPTPAPTPTTTPTPTPTPAFITISGKVLYCSNPAPGPVPNVTLTLTGDATNSTFTDSSGNYQFSPLATGGSYNVTPGKTARIPGSTGINTVDVIATQRHFLNLTLLSGCRLTAADVTGDTVINSVDVIAIQQFFFGHLSANVGKYQFNPASRTYSPLISDQTAQNYDTLIFGDVASPFAE